MEYLIKLVLENVERFKSRNNSFELRALTGRVNQGRNNIRAPGDLLIGRKPTITLGHKSFLIELSGYLVHTKNSEKAQKCK